MANQQPGQSWCCHIFPAPESEAKTSVDVDFSLCWGCPSTQHLAASSGCFWCCKVLYWLNLSDFQTGSSPWLQAILTASGGRWCLLLPWMSPPWAFISFSHRKAGTELSSSWGLECTGQETPMGTQPSPAGHSQHHKSFSSCWASSPRSHLNCQMNQHRNVSDWSEGFAWTWLVPGSSSPAFCKENVFCLLGWAVFSHLCFSTGYNPLHTPRQLSFVQISRAIMRRLHGSHF